MAEIKTIYKGESVTILFTFPETYNMERLTSHKVFVGETEFAGVKDGQTVKLQLKSSDTDRMVGTHRVVLWLDDTTLGLRKPYCGDLVVARTQAAGNTVSVSNISDIIIPITISETAVTVGDVLYNYVKGDPFTYSDFTPEQIEALKVKGDAFEYSDFTPEQIALLQKPASDAAGSIALLEGEIEGEEALRVTAETNRNNAEGLRLSAEIIRNDNESDRIESEELRTSAETSRQTAEGLRQQAELNRQTNTSTAISNAEQATDDANDAALLANEKAGLANEKALLADEKAGLAATATTQANTARDGANSAAQSATNLVNSYATDLAAKELKDNKQNSLATDGTGTKFPTVDAVKTRADDIESLIIRKLVTPLGATYNTTTKLYSLNGLTDITEEQMINIYNYTAVMIKASSWNEAFNSVNFRTNIQGTNKGNLNVTANYSFTSNAHLEVFKMNSGVYISNTTAMFGNCPALREVNLIYMQMALASQADSMFQNCAALVTCNLRNLKVNLSLAWSPLLSLASLQYIIQYRANGTTPITITVHPTVFAKLTDNTNYPTWYALNQNALINYITFATA